MNAPALDRMKSTRTAQSRRPSVERQQESASAFASPRTHTSSGHASTAASPSSPTSPASTASFALAGAEHFTVKAVREDSIVLLRAAYAMPLAQVRARLRDKFAVQEGVQLSRAFVVGWAPSAGGGGVAGLAALRGRPRSNSASSVGTLNPQALRYVRGEQDWRAAVAACAGGKMTIRLFNAQPI